MSTFDDRGAMDARRLSADDVLGALTEWKPGHTEFVVFTQEDYERITAQLFSDQKARLEGVTCLPLEIFTEEDQ
jgi:hypothetical protein